VEFSRRVEIDRRGREELIVKGIVSPKVKIVSLITHPHVVPNTCSKHK